MDPKNLEQLAQAIADAIRLQDVPPRSNEQRGGEAVLIPVGVSARHIHLSREDADTLFGKDYQLTKKAVLMGGQFATNETVTVVGAKLRSIENVRVLGPLRKQTQLEISATDKLKLGVAAPLRESGDLKGSAPISIAGPKGAVHLTEGCIVAARHIHLPPCEAAKRALKDGSIVSVEVPGERGLVLNNVKVRVHETFTAEMHIDTDEANACGVKTGDRLRIIHS